jgi:hypothetical protein
MIDVSSEGRLNTCRGGKLRQSITVTLEFHKGIIVAHVLAGLNSSIVYEVEALYENYRVVYHPENGRDTPAGSLHDRGVKTSRTTMP